MRSRSFPLKVTILWAIALIFWSMDNSSYAACPNIKDQECPDGTCISRTEQCPLPEAGKTELQECIDKCDKWNQTSKASCKCKCNGGVVLNTDIPFVGRCILKDGTASGWWTAISGISRALTSIFMTLILTWGFAMIIWWWVQISMGDIKGGRSKIFNVIVAFAVLWSLGILLRLINPNFFK